MNNFSASVELSVALCTWNSGSIVEDALTSLAFQSLARKSYEVLVIDNASMSKIAERLKQCCKKYGFRYIIETQLGLSNARNRAIEEATGKYIYFIDDDAVAPAHILETIIRCFRETGCDIVGGPAHGLWADKPPRWLSSRYWWGLSLISYGPSRRLLRYPEIPLGCNVAFKRQLFDDFGYFRTDLGRTGNNFIGHEERALLQVLMTAGKVVMYEPRAYVFHAVGIERMKIDYLKKRLAGGIKSDDRMRGEKSEKHETVLKRILIFFYGQLLTVFHAIIFATEFYILDSRLRWVKLLWKKSRD
jgi:glycosyltransferase involved in cell wall biosynthesis